MTIIPPGGMFGSSLTHTPRGYRKEGYEMAKEQRRRVSGRTALKLAMAAAIFVVGMLVGGGIADGTDGSCGAQASTAGVAR